MLKAMTAVSLCLAACPVFAGGGAVGQAYTEENYFSVVFPSDWVKKDSGFGLSKDEKKVYGVEMFGPVSDGLAVIIGVQYYAPENLVHKTPERFVKLHSQPALGVNLDGRVYGKVKSGKAGGCSTKVFERKVFEYLPPDALHPKKIPVYESFTVVPVKNGFYVLRYYAPMAIAKANLKAYEAVLASFKPLVR